MLAWANVRTIAFLATAAALTVGCVEDNQPSSGYYAGGSGSGSGGGTSSGAVGSTTPSASPILVDVDPGRTLNANPGDGVGVFTEYVSGGHWHVWWTCDTNKSTQSCSFDVRVSVDRDTITNVTGEVATAPSTGIVQNASGIEDTTLTRANIDGMHFDTTPGAIITLTATMDGNYDGQFLFFVQDGQVNGNYPGTVTDPLMLEGKTP